MIKFFYNASNKSCLCVCTEGVKTKVEVDNSPENEWVWKKDFKHFCLTFHLDILVIQSIHS